MGFRSLFKRKPMGLSARVGSMTLDKLSIAWERLRSEPDAAAMVFGFAIMRPASENDSTLPFYLKNGCGGRKVGVEGDSLDWGKVKRFSGNAPTAAEISAILAK